VFIAPVTVANLLPRAWKSQLHRLQQDEASRQVQGFMILANESFKNGYVLLVCEREIGWLAVELRHPSAL
jgi:hypothetical protein